MITATGNVYPTRVLEGAETALVLFAAAFGGSQDAAFVRDAGLTATCVDTDTEKLLAMADDYPEDWQFVVGDAFGLRYPPDSFDVVSLDPFRGGAMEQAANEIENWCEIAKRAVVLGVDSRRRVVPPDGWEATELMSRHGRMGTHWLVFEPC